MSFLHQLSVTQLKLINLRYMLLRSCVEYDYNHGWVIISDSGTMSSNRKKIDMLLICERLLIKIT
jgi:hypothetical protein